jgi:cell division transport system permease protein
MANHSLREAIAAFRRAPILVVLSATSIGLSLFVLGAFGIVAHNVNVSLQAIEQRVEVVAYLRDDISATQLEVLQNDVRSFPEVESITHVSKFEAMRAAMQQLAEFRDVFTDLEVNPLPASLEIQLRPQSRDPESVERVAELISLYPFVEDVRYGREWVDKIYQLRRLAGYTAAVLGIAFAVVAILIIGTTVRMAVLARSEEIAIMRLVGATDGFIRRPFLLEGRTGRIG